MSMPIHPGFFPPYDPSDNIGTSKNWTTLMSWGMNQVPIDNDYDSGVEVNLTDKLQQAVIQKRNYYRKMAFARYHELILNIRDYANVPVSFNKLKCEWYLRNGNAVAVGMDKLGNFQMLGIVNDTNTTTAPSAPFSVNRLTGNDINYLIPKQLIPEKAKEITQLDDAITGNFVILRNKPFEYVNDFAIIKFYCDRLAELMVSRASLIMQAKITTVVPVEEGNSETADQIVAQLYNGAPYVEMNHSAARFKDMIAPMGDSTVPDRIKTLKQAFNDEQNELNNMLGINSTGIDKASGVSDKEVDSNNDYVISTTNMYIRGVQEGLDLYNARYGTKYFAYMNQPSMQQLDLGGDSNADNNDD